MKFTYEDKKESCECVAVIWHSHLVVQDDCGDAVVLAGPNAADPMEVFTSPKESWESYVAEATHKFYHGDKVTIEF